MKETVHINSSNETSRRAILNTGEDEEIVVVGYKRCRIKTAVCWFCFIVTGGLLRLFMYWLKHWFLLATHVSCPLEYAEKLLISEHQHGKHTVHYVKDVITLNAEKIKRMQLQRDNKFEECTSDVPIRLPVHFSGGIFTLMDSLRMFKFKQLRYVWDSRTSSFVQLKGLDCNVPSVLLHQQKGLNKAEQNARQLVYGNNEITIPWHSVLKLIFLEVSSPFQVFQGFSLCVWISDDYYFFATAVALMTLFMTTMSIIETRKNQQSLREKVKNSGSVSVVYSDGSTALSETNLLVPGDVLEIPSSGCLMTCDAVLLSGNCILDESMLTGESVPVTKTPLPCKRDLVFHQREHARNVLFNGTKVIQTRSVGSEKVLVVVINTGNMTAKGGLVRSILYPPPIDYKFENDANKFIMFMATIAICGFLYTLQTKIAQGEPAEKIAIDELTLITIAVQPALFATISVGRYYAQHRLKKKNIFCMSSRAINMAGSIDCVCFDKTGTLTEDGLDMWGVVPTTSTNYFQIPVRQVQTLPYDHLLFGMVTCHSISVINGELKGYPLDLKLFESTGWLLEESNGSKHDLKFLTTFKPPKEASAVNDRKAALEKLSIGVVREFTFSSSLQRMSVITRQLSGKNFNVYCKGSPEMILTLCKPHSIPIDFNTKLDQYTLQGFRVIAVAQKLLHSKITYEKVQRISRERIECDLEFLGFVVMENRLKADTTSVIKSLQAADIRTIMVTGDNMFTAVSVARHCDMITKTQTIIEVNARSIPVGGHELSFNILGGSIAMPLIDTQALNQSGYHVDKGIKLEEIDDDPLELVPKLPNTNYRFAMIGKTWRVIREYFPELLPKFVTRGTIFARMAPEQKQSLILELQNLGYYVAMCGDGANDCGALRAAHTGISLSEAESSVASPFLSKHPTIACVQDVIKEGRAALVTSVGIFKYMAAYSLLQFFSVVILQTIGSNFAGLQFLYIDLWMTVFAFFFCRTSAYEGPLAKQTPQNSLISFSSVASLMFYLISVIAFQLGGWYYLKAQDWYEPFQYTSNLSSKAIGCVENYTVFSISCFQYVILPIIFFKAAPYRKSIFTNYGLIAAIALYLGFTVFLILNPPRVLASVFQLVLPPNDSFRFYVIGYGVVNFILSFLIEVFIIERIFVRRLRYRFHNIEKSRRRFLSIENDLRQHPSWPPPNLYQNCVPLNNNEPSMMVEINVSSDSENQLAFGQNNDIVNNFCDSKTYKFTQSIGNNVLDNGYIEDKRANQFSSVHNPENQWKTVKVSRL